MSDGSSSDGVQHDGLTDRDRLAMAFAELRELDYLADITMAFRVCCHDCGMMEMARQIWDDEDGPFDPEACYVPEKFVFWSIEKDDWSFVDSSDGFPLPHPYSEMDAEALDAIGDEVLAAVTSLRVGRYVNLVHPLSLHWAGSADVIVSVLRKHGLDCDVPNSDHWCIEVTTPSTVRTNRHRKLEAS